ncbi:MAG: ABC transporter permease [Verrucomicrobiae bacterium]|nr:ABC transporter permease [Verrucomicrobiae bacterium]
MLRFGGLFKKQRQDRELDEEIESHLQMHIEDNLRLGLTPEEARRQAMIKLGGVESTKEAYRDQRGLPGLETLWQDLRYAARQLRKNPGFTAVAVLTLALGIGSTTAIFSVVNAVLLRALPYPDPDQLVELTDRDGPIAIPNFTDWKEQQTVFEQMALYRVVNLNVRASQGDPLRVLSVELGADAFTALRLNPVVGRFYSPAEDTAGGPPIAVLGHGFWQKQFGSDPEVVNQSLLINGISHTVLGVMPPTFDLVEKAELFVPVEPGISETDRNNQSSYEAVARLKPGISFDQARVQMTAISQRLAELHPDTNKDRLIGLKTLIEARVGGVRRALWILLGSVGFVLLIACANVANLLMVRAVGRRKEMAVRSALGANQGRILRQMLTEGLLLAMFGGGLGLLFARVSMTVIGALAQNSLPRAHEIGIDSRVLLFSAAAAVLTGLLFGFAPAWQSSRPSLSGMMNEGSRGSSAGRTPLLNGLMVGQVAMSLMLLLGAGLLLRSFYHLTWVQAGFDHERVLSFRLDLPDETHRTPGEIDRFSQNLLGRLRALPGVQAASVATEIPIGGRSWATSLLIEGRPEPSSLPAMEINLIGSDYFKVLNIPVLKGRAFTEADSREVLGEPRAGQSDWAGLRSIVIDEEFARRHFPSEDPLGKQIRLPWGPRDQNPVMTVVGIVGRVKHEKLKEENAKVLPMGYLAYRERPNKHIAVVIKTVLPTETLAQAARQEVTTMDAGLPIYEVLTFAEIRENNLAPDRLNLALLGTAAVIALVLAVIGIYGVVAFSIAQRRREMGVRMALGARRVDVVNLVLSQGLKLVLLGTVLGLAGALGLSRLLASFLFQVDPTDLVTFAVVPAALLGAAALACTFPALRAARVDPMVALRNE